MIHVALAVQQKKGISMEDRLKLAAELGFRNVQIALWDMDRTGPSCARETAELLKNLGLETRELWCGWHGPAAWNFTEGPGTLGLVPEAFRQIRLKDLEEQAEYARILGVSTVITHLGFLPADPLGGEYKGFVKVLRQYLDYLQDREMTLLMETGQETPTAIMRLLEDADRPNLGVNFDPANLMMYGNGNALDALRLLLPHVLAVHAKDGTYPADGKTLGREMPLGQGEVQFRRLALLLREQNFSGTVAVENERKIPETVRKGEITDARNLIEELFELQC